MLSNRRLVRGSDGGSCAVTVGGGRGCRLCRLGAAQHLANSLVRSSIDDCWSCKYSRLSQVGAASVVSSAATRAALLARILVELIEFIRIGNEKSDQFQRISQLVAGSFGIGKSDRPAAKGAITLQTACQTATLIQPLQATVGELQHVAKLSGLQAFFG